MVCESTHNQRVAGSDEVFFFENPQTRGVRALAGLIVGYVPASNDLGIFGIVWRCVFSSKFLFVTEKKITFCRKFFGGPRSPKT